jgi:hypothetical protein
MRRKDREITQTEEILCITEKAKVLHLALFDGEYPYVVPLHYGFEYSGGKLVFFCHGAKEGHKIDLIRKDPHVCIELECDIESIPGGEEPCRYGSAYASVIGRGTAELVRDEEEKIRGLELLMKNQTGRDFPISEQMASTVEVIKLTITDFTAKARKNQERKE